MKVLISQPMGSRTAEEVRENRKEIVKVLTVNGHEILDNVFLDEPSEEVVNKQIYYLSKAIKLMTKADIIVFTHDWESSRGCRIEHDIAINYKIPIIELKAYNNCSELFWLK